MGKIINKGMNDELSNVICLQYLIGTGWINVNEICMTIETLQN